VNNPGAATLGLDRAQEFYLLQELADSGLAPRPKTAAAHAGFLAVGHLSGKPLCLSEFQNAATLEAVGRLLARLHQVSSQAATPLQLPARIQGYATLAGGAEAQQMAEEAQTLLARLPGAGKTCLCHNDVNAANLLRQADGSLALIDWEYAAIGPPAFELGLVAEYHALTDAATRLLLAAYDQAGGSCGADIVGLTGWRHLYRLVQTLWSAAVLRQTPVRPDSPDSGLTDSQGVW